MVSDKVKIEYTSGGIPYAVPVQAGKFPIAYKTISKNKSIQVYDFGSGVGSRMVWCYEGIKNGKFYRGKMRKSIIHVSQYGSYCVKIDGKVYELGTDFTRVGSWYQR